MPSRKTGRVIDTWDFFRYARVVRNAGEYATLLPDYFRASFNRVDPDLFSAVHTCVFFTGVGRSGTTLLGALLDAHPNMVIANQQGVLKYLYPLRFPRQQIFSLLLCNSARSAREERSGGGGYTYTVPGQWQGRFRCIEVIGDKSKSAQSTEWLYSNRYLPRRLANTVQARIRIIYVIRNPLDVIARRSIRRGVSLERISAQYFALTEKLRIVQQQLSRESALDLEFIRVHLEDLIADPAAQLARICLELGVQPEKDYLNACAGIVYTKPTEPRKQVDWPAPLRADIERRMKEAPYLRRYLFGGDDGCEK
jgi:hypothetical protein